ncbi:hypothetical protein HPB47_028089 [Ixodes persulcatus]|uniref:Uncharacterized protein n=1 Tax=Ixodes persulcatus TaxID=34615 RepID=A0AC60PUB2_IXOPE|nr:hypothetical protein HPB47_028089 [Ixodes persulcatus]
MALAAVFHVACNRWRRRRSLSFWPFAEPRAVYDKERGTFKTNRQDRLFLGPPCCHVFGFLYQHVYGKDAILRAASSGKATKKKNLKTTPYEKLEEALYTWFMDMRAKNTPISGKWNCSCLQRAHRLREVCASAFDEALAVEDHQLLS